MMGRLQETWNAYSALTTGESDREAKAALQHAVADVLSARGPLRREFDRVDKQGLLARAAAAVDAPAFADYPAGGGGGSDDE